MEELMATVLERQIESILPGLFNFTDGSELEMKAARHAAESLLLLLDLADSLDRQSELCDQD
jgi:hypothetical protein